MQNTPRQFLFLQGPHGPFFARLGRMLTRAGCGVWRVGFNAGDEAFWPRKTYLPYRGALADWAAGFEALVAEHAITDIVLYGDTRPVHALAIDRARTLGLRVHVFEEGYLRPYWVTYERGGSNGHSRLMQMRVEQMAADLAEGGHDMHPAPATWGDMRQHVFWGAAYHWFVLFRNQRYPRFARHRALPVSREALLYSKRLILMPFAALRNRLAAAKVRRSTAPYHLCLLQLEHDASFQAHSPFATMEEFLRLVIAGFAAGAPAHHHLVLKAHPLEMGRRPLARIIRDLAFAHGLAGRVHFLRGGKLGPLLDHARAVVTVNSTAGQQALWRGLPLRTFGTTVYDQPEFVSDQPLPAFFASPQRPDAAAYRLYRRYLLETSQVPGGFYSARGRRQLLRVVTDMILDEADPYDALRRPPEPQKLRVVGARPHG